MRCENFSQIGPAKLELWPKRVKIQILLLVVVVGTND
jgi:hypothetical protein